MSHTGIVTAFDGEAGLGVITGADGTEHPFHCVEIADGSRTIDVAAPVRFRLLYKLGRVEAAGIDRDDGAG